MIDNFDVIGRTAVSRRCFCKNFPYGTEIFNDLDHEVNRWRIEILRFHLHE